MGQTPKTKTILILDDEPDVITYFETLFEDNGYCTVSAQDGVEGLSQARQRHPDLVTLDVSMPRRSGAQFYRAMKADPQLRDIPVIVVTAVTELAGMPYAFHKGRNGEGDVPLPEAFVSKPIDRDDFLAKVEEILTATKTKGH